MLDKLRALWRLLKIALSLIYITVHNKGGKALGLASAGEAPYNWHKMVRRLLNLQIKVIGSPCQEKPTLYVGNHSSYLDITVLGVHTRGRFIAKREVGTWPIFGYLSRMQDTIYIERDPKKAKQQGLEIETLLRNGENLILFPEGTTNDGSRILPFKSSLFAVADKLKAEGKPLWVQPMSVAYTHKNGLPLGRLDRPQLTWYGDMDLEPHFWQVLQMSSINVELTFHEPVNVTDVANRKELAKHCFEAIRSSLYASYQKPVAAPPPRKRFSLMKKSAARA